METAKHSKLPWRLSEDGHDIYGGYHDGSWPGHMLIATISHDLKGNGYAFTPEEHKEIHANAEFIILACNNHDALVEALKECLAIAEDRQAGSYDDIMRVCRAALRLAGVTE